MLVEFGGTGDRNNAGFLSAAISQPREQCHVSSRDTRITWKEGKILL